MKRGSGLGAAFLLLAVGGFAQEGKGLVDRIREAEERLRKAQAEEKATRAEEDSREMARSATREIARAEGEKLERARRDKEAADALVKELCAELATLEKDAAGEPDAARKEALGRSAASTRKELESARALAALKDGAVKRLAESHAREHALYAEKQQDLDRIQRALAEKVLASREAESALRALSVEVAAKDAEEKASARKRAEEALRESRDPAGQAAVKAACAEASKAAEDSAAACARVREAAAQADLMVLLARQVLSALDLSRKDPEKGYRDPGSDARRLKETFQRLGEETYASAVRIQGGLEPLPACEWDYAKARHLLVRAGFGGTPQEVQRLCAMGLYKAVDHLVDVAFLPSPDAPFEIVPPAREPALSASVRQLGVRGAEGLVSMRTPQPKDHFQTLKRWWARRIVESPRPLQEKLAIFWHGHFANQFSVVGHTYMMYRQNQLFREHATGNFGALLHGVVHDPAMLRYLDNTRNVKGKPNENLAREIMELFAMGVDQGYTQKDIVEGARALTGYTCDPVDGLFRLAHAQHDGEDKVIFGRRGPWTGDDFVRLILEQPATSRFVAGKLYAYFAHREPDPDAVGRLASVLRANHFELTPMLKNLFLSKRFYASDVVGAQIKSPVQLVVGTLKDLGLVRLGTYAPVEEALQEMGQELFEPPDVKGWRYGRSWISSARVLTRYNRIADLVRKAPRAGAPPGADVVAILDPKGSGSPEQIVDALVRTFLAKPLPAEKRTELAGALAGLPPAASWTERRDEVNARLRNVLVLLMSTPEYQMF